jgi:hypothetical protein
VVAVHDDPWLTGEKERAAAAIGARDVHGKGKRGANGVTVISWFCWAKEKRRGSRRDHRTRWRRRGGWRAARDDVARAEEGSKEGEQSRDKERTTRGGRSSRWWRGGGGQSRSTAPAAGGAEQSTCPRKKKRGEGSGGPVWKF